MSRRRSDSLKEEKDISEGLRKTRIFDKKTGGPSTSKDEFVVKDAGAGGLRKTRISHKKTGGPSTSKDEFVVEDAGAGSNVASGSKLDEKSRKELAAALEPYMEDIEKMLNDFAKEAQKREILGAGLLDDMKYHGMGLIKMLKETCTYLGKDWEVIRKWTLFKQSELSWDRISKYMAEYENPENPQYSHPWARLIDPGYFADLACKRNVFLCGIFGVVVAEAQGHQGIWQSVWAQAKENQALLVLSKRIGAKFLEEHRSSIREEKERKNKLRRDLIRLQNEFDKL